MDYRSWYQNYRPSLLDTSWYLAGRACLLGIRYRRCIPEEQRVRALVHTSVAYCTCPNTSLVAVHGRLKCTTWTFRMHTTMYLSTVSTIAICNAYVFHIHCIWVVKCIIEYGYTHYTMYIVTKYTVY